MGRDVLFLLTRLASLLRLVRHYGDSMARSFAKSFYNSKEWQQVRDAVMRRDFFLCQHCGRPATEVHHIIHLTPDNIGDTSITMNMDNLVSLCRDCHFEEHRGEHAAGRKAQADDDYGYEFNADGVLLRKVSADG